MTGGYGRSMNAAEHLKVCHADYVAAESGAAERHAFHDGEVYAMAGGSTVHALLALEFGALLRNALVGSPCAATGADQRIHKGPLEVLPLLQTVDI